MTDVVQVDAPELKADVFDLHAAAAEFYDSFPAWKGRLTFIDVTSGAIINSDPAKVEAISQLAATPEGREEIMPIFAHCTRNKCPHTQFTNDGDCIIFMYTQDDYPHYFGNVVTRARELQFIFDHETGHVVVPEGSSKDRLKAENAADAFALLRDLKRGGNDALAEAALMFRTTFALFSKGGMINFSAPMIEDFLNQGAKLSQEEIPFERMISLAGEFADRNTMDAGRAEAFKRSIEKLHGYPSLGALTNVVMETPLPDTFKWTAEVLKAALDGRIKLPGTTTEAFDEVARDAPPRLKDREREFSRPPVTTRPAAAMMAPA
jgi:hypothetical protein